VDSPWTQYIVILLGVVVVRHDSVVWSTDSTRIAESPARTDAGPHQNESDDDHQPQEYNTASRRYKKELQRNRGCRKSKCTKFWSNPTDGYVVSRARANLPVVHVRPPWTVHICSRCLRLRACDVLRLTLSLRFIYVESSDVNFGVRIKLCTPLTQMD
jgi:hypothetical protein